VEGLRNDESEHDADQDNEPDIKGEDNAIEMTDNFDGKLHEMDADGKYLLWVSFCAILIIIKIIHTNIC